VVYPVIPKGHIILRLIPTAVHTEQDITETIDAFKAVKHKLDSKLYPTEIPDIN
jgi:glycine C-acetyltransferase